MVSQKTGLKEEKTMAKVMMEEARKALMKALAMYINKMNELDNAYFDAKNEVNAIFKEHLEAIKDVVSGTNS